MGSCCLMHACSTTSGAESVSISYRFRNEVQASRQARSNNNRDQTAYNLHSNSKDPPNRHRYPVERRTSIIKHACIQNSEKPLIRQSVQKSHTPSIALNLLLSPPCRPMTKRRTISPKPDVLCWDKRRPCISSSSSAGSLDPSDVRHVCVRRFGSIFSAAA
jgi:hypothetical protein